MLSTGYQANTPAAVRYPRGSGTGVAAGHSLETLPIGKGKIVRQGQGIALLCFGTLLQQAKPVADKLDATLVDMRFVKPLDTELLQSLLAEHDIFVTIEENAVHGGAGSAVNEWMMTQRQLKPVLNIGIPDQFIEQGTQEEIYQLLQLDSSGLEAQIQQFLHR